MSKWWNPKQAWVGCGSNGEPRWKPRVSTSAVGHVRAALPSAAGLVMFLLPLVLLMLLQWLGWRLLLQMSTTHFTSVELEKNRNLKYHLIQTEKALSFACCVHRNTWPGEKEKKRRNRRKRESFNIKSKVDPQKKAMQQ